MKKTYYKPETNVVNLDPDVMMAPVSGVNPGDGQGPVTDDTTGGHEIDAKHYNAWDSWDE